MAKDDRTSLMESTEASDPVTGPTGPMEPTGSILAPTCRLIVRRFDRYEIVLRVCDEDQSVEVVEIRVRTDFLSPQQHIRASGYQDVEEFYED